VVERSRHDESSTRNASRLQVSCKDALASTLVLRVSPSD
jgi:hypothetical protein